MDLNLLKTFYEVAKQLSFTKASKKLYITQPAVTSQIKTLEESLGGVTLFKKVGRKIFITDEGKTLLKYATQLVETEEEILNIFNGLAEGVRGKLTIGATYVMGSYFLPSILAKFKNEYPFVEIKTIINNSSMTISNILNGVVDVAIAGLVEKSTKSLIIKPFHKEKMVFIASSKCDIPDNTKIDHKRLNVIPFIAREMGTVTRLIMDKWLKENDLYHNLSMELGNVEAVKKMVEEGFGVSIIPEITVKREVKAGYLKILDVEESNMSVDYYLIYPPNIKSIKSCSVFIDFLLTRYM